MKIDHNPDEFKMSIADAKEKAFQRAIISAGQSYLDGDIVEWIDIEMPVSSGRTKRFDLIGVDASGQYVLCELKFFNKKSDGGTPVVATSQILEYLDALNDYCKKLKDAGLPFRLHTNAKQTSLDIDKFLACPPRLVIAANKAYWENEVVDLSELDDRIGYYSVDVDANAFELQKGNKDAFVPEMPPTGMRWAKIR